MDKITSLQNPRIKNIIKLAKGKERRAQNLFILEGARELSLALSAGYRVESLFICPELFVKSSYPKLLELVNNQLIYEVSKSVFEKIAYRENSDGLITLLHQKKHTLSDIILSPNPFIIVLEGVEKPGNLGAILRTADAAKADALIICDPLTDIYNPNAIRSSIGCLFSMQVASCTSDEALLWLKHNKIVTIATELNNSHWYHHIDYNKPSAIIMGTEANGLTHYWLEQADCRIKIPMRGKIDSLNVSVATAIITFEAMRQRGF